MMYLTRMKKYNSPCRFDVVSIFSLPGEGLKVKVVRDAFELSEGY